jgi:hypothetical protein
MWAYRARLRDLLQFSCIKSIAVVISYDAPHQQFPMPQLFFGRIKPMLEFFGKLLGTLFKMVESHAQSGNCAPADDQQDGHRPQRRQEPAQTESVDAVDFHDSNRGDDDAQLEWCSRPLLHLTSG